MSCTRWRALARIFACVMPLLPTPASGALTPAQIGVIANTASKDSLEIARYYIERRGIPEGNLITVALPSTGPTLTRAAFAAIKTVVDGKTPPTVQAYALAWTEPFRVGCMSITTAFAAGFDERFCGGVCQGTRPLPYFNSDTGTPWDTYRIRPTMALAGKSVAEVKALIDRGISSDGMAPAGTAYLLSTTDKARNVRATGFPAIVERLGSHVKIERILANSIENRQDVMFYFTGRTHVDKLATLKFLPGAIADHLTSAGGVLTGENKQMRSLDWLSAGATGSYGTVVEPCAFTAKFPAPGVVMRRYLDGETLIEAYWKSVAQPGQGIFIGEPLAAPYRTPELSRRAGADTLK